jgi:hypothetical protein
MCTADDWDELIPPEIAPTSPGKEIGVSKSAGAFAEPEIPEI